MRSFWHRATLCGLVWGLSATAALPGAWAREEGESFLAFGGNVLITDSTQRPVHYDPSIYFEYGLTDRITLGFDGYLADKGEAGNLFGFARIPVAPAEWDTRVALSFAAGVVQIPNGTVEPTLRFGVHLGRGLDQGWLALDALYYLAPEAQREQLKLDLTWGHRLTDRWTTILTGELGTGLEGDFYAKISPSIAFDLSEAVTLRGGVTQALTGDRGTGLGVGLWWTF